MPGFSGGAALGAQLYVIWTWRGVWRWLAAAPLLMMAAFVALIPALTLLEPRIADTWPLFLAVINYSSLLWLALLGLTRVVIHWATVY